MTQDNYSDKASLRKNLKERREAIDPVSRQEAIDKALRTLLPLCRDAPHVLSYMSLGSEFDLTEFNASIMREGRLVLPRIYKKRLELYQVNSLDDLEKHPWGVLQPDPNKCILVYPQSIDIAIIPGLGFDLKTKIRLGYGKGHYDQLLPNLEKAEFWGVGFKAQEEADLPIESHDVAMHKILLF